MDPQQQNSQQDNQSNPPAQQLVQPNFYAQSSPPSEPIPRKSKKKKILLFSLLALLVLGGSGGFVFGYYLPHKPENVWKMSMRRTSEALNAITQNATEPARLESFSKSQITGKVSFKNDSTDVSADLHTKFDAISTDGTIEATIKTPEQADKVFGAAFLSQQQKDSIYPNIYFKLHGLKTLGIEGLEAFLPGITDYDDKWIAAESEYLRSVAASLQSETPIPSPAPVPAPVQPPKESRVTASDVGELARTITKTVNEYLLTTDPAKAVFEQRSFSGKETVDNSKLYRYKVGINESHAKDACKVIINRLAGTAVYKKLSGKDATNQQAIEDEKTESTKNCQESTANRFDKDTTFDLWIDATYQLVHTVRIYDKGNAKSYTDIGQTYHGGDEVTLFSAMHDNDSSTDSTITVVTNMKSGKTTAKLALKSTAQHSAYDVSMSLDAEPLAKTVEIEKPAGALPVKDIFDRYGINPAAGLSLFTGGEEPQLGTDLIPGIRLPATYEN